MLAEATLVSCLVSLSVVPGRGDVKEYPEFLGDVFRTLAAAHGIPAVAGQTARPGRAGGEAICGPRAHGTRIAAVIRIREIARALRSVQAETRVAGAELLHSSQLTRLTCPSAGRAQELGECLGRDCLPGCPRNEAWRMERRGAPARRPTLHIWQGLCCPTRRPSLWSRISPPKTPDARPSQRDPAIECVYLAGGLMHGAEASPTEGSGKLVRSNEQYDLEYLPGNGFCAPSLRGWPAFQAHWGLHSRASAIAAGSALG
jgi:hypothetical protein